MAYTNIDLPTDYFNTILYTGTGSSNARTGVGFQPDWVWIKERNASADHGLYDAVRGVTKQLESNTTTAETTEATGLTAFGTDGFTVGALAQLNTSGDTYVAWNWLALNTTTSNTSGSITSTVSANTTSGFSIVSYTGTGANATVGHGLGVAPKMVIIKNRGDVSNWPVWHSGLSGNSYYLYFNLTNAQSNVNAMWNNTAPTSTVFSLGTSTDSNQSTKAMIAYCFAEVKGYSKFGSYTGNGSADGPFIYTGFKPAYLMIKPSSYANSWLILDNKRNTFNPVKTRLEADGSGADSSTLDYADFLSNGFKIRTSNGHPNTSGGTLIYMAFAENPFVSSTGIPTTAR
jgi:hypothetical protein